MRSAFARNQRRRLAGRPQVERHGLCGQHHRHQHAVEEAGLMSVRRTHEHDVLAGDGDVIDEAARRRHHGVGRMHDRLGLARGAGGVDQLNHVVGSRPQRCKLRFLDGGQGRAVEKRALERLRSLAVDGKYVPQVRQVRADLIHHRDVIKTAPARRHEHDLRVGKTQHEAHLALAKDRHQRVGGGTDAVAGEEQRGELAPVRQLKRDHVALADTEPNEAGGDLVDALSKLGVCKSHLLA
jgi:hypothetical protein